MEHNDDPKLSELVREWQVSGAPPSLDARISNLRRRWWSTVLAGSIRVPIPIGVAVAAALLMMAGALVRQRPESPAAPAPVPSISLVEFRPVTDLNVRVIPGMVEQHETN
jgi:hypothetical protein